MSSSASSSSTSAGSSSTSPASASASTPASSSSGSSDGSASSAAGGETSSPKRRRTEGVSAQSTNDGDAMQDVPQETSSSAATTSDSGSSVSAPVTSPTAASSASSSSSASAAPAAASAQSAALREQMRANLLRYLRQLTVGCGLAGCSNKDCVTGGAAPVAGNVALSRAQQLYKNHVPSCVPEPAGAAPVAASASPAVAAPAAAASAAASITSSSVAPAATTAAGASTPAAAVPSAASPAPVTPARASPPAAAAASPAAPSSGVPLSVPRPRAASSSGASAAAGSSSSSSSSRISPAAPSPPASPRVSPSLSAMLASSTPMAGPLKSTEAPIESASAFVAQVDAARAAWVAMGSPANDVSPFRPLVTRLYKVFNELNCLNLSFRVERSEEDEGVKQQRREEAKEEEEKAALLAAASRRGADAMTDVASSSSSTLTVPLPAAAATAAAPASSGTAVASTASAAGASSPFLEADEWSPAIDYADLDAFYASILSVSVVGSDGAESFPLLTGLLNGMRALLNELLFRPLPASQVHPALLRAVLILLHASPADEQQDLWSDPQHYDTLRLLTQFVAALPRPAKKLLVSWFSDVERWRPGVPVVLSARQRRLMYSRDRLEKLLGSLQQFISVRIFDRQDLRDCVPAIMSISLVHEANERLAALYRAIPLSVPRSAKTPVPLDEKLFYNDAVNECADLKTDFRRWMEQLHGRRVGASDFSFSKYSFVLDAGSKAMLLKYDAQMQQHAHYRSGVLGSHTMSERDGYLILEVARANLVADTMRALANKSPLDYKKPLKVHFKGEKGIDAGGLRKEFFQLIVAALFDARYGMFLVDHETHTFRFNPDSMDAPMEFELIGALLGISIYNSTILDMHFPQVVYKQLLGLKPTLDDLLASQPSLGNGLQQLLEFDGDVEATFARDFTVSYERYGEQVVVELKPGGAQIPVTNANRYEFVSLYVEYALEKSIARQFGAFNKGFQRACGGEALKLFRPFELELLVCGAQEFDFDALEASTRYEDGYTKDSTICKQFWEIVHQELTLDEKKRLLEFCTGSDRVPIKGLAAMQLTISKQGPDSPQLPTSHTCFNHLLLPDYSSKDKLRTLLRLALQNSKGFGLI